MPMPNCLFCSSTLEREIRAFCLSLQKLAAVSVILFVPVFLEYLNTGLVPRFPTLIACGFILLAGIQSFFSGMMLEVMAAKDRKDFEYRLNRVHGEHQERKG